MISIIIPVLDEADALRATIEQFKVLSLPNEIIVADGGSTDETVQIARSYADKVAIHPTDKHQTIGSNRNNGALLARGEYLVFVDAGVVIPDIDFFFKRALSHFEKNKKLLALSVSIYIDPATATFFDKLFFGIGTFVQVILNNYLHKGIAQGKFQMIRSDAFTAIGGYREDLPATEDQDLFARLARLPCQALGGQARLPTSAVSDGGLARKGRTMIDPKLVVYHPGRRVHALGWPRLIFIYWRDAISLAFRGKVVSKDWKKVK